MGNLANLEVRQTEVNYSAALESPAFALGARWMELQSAIYAHLAQFKLRLGDIKVESATANPGDVSFACWMLNYAVVARYRLDRVEVWSNSARVASDVPMITDIVKHTVAALRDVSPESRVATHSVGIAIHGLLGGQGQAAAHIASYVTVKPEDSPLLTPSGVSFLCELPSGEGQGSIVLERSAIVPDGAFIRVVSEHPGVVPEVDAVRRGAEFFQATTARLGLDIVWGS